MAVASSFDWQTSEEEDRFQTGKGSARSGIDRLSTTNKKLYLTKNNVFYFEIGSFN